MLLSTNYKTWSSTIDSIGVESLVSESSVSNIHRVLSTAQTRAPQRELCSKVISHVKYLLESREGISVLTSLIEYGTPRTVNTITAELIRNDRELFTFRKTPTFQLTKALSKLLERIVYRIDSKSAERDEIIEALETLPMEKHTFLPFVLPAMGRLIINDVVYSHKFLESELMNVLLDNTNEEEKSILNEALYTFTNIVLAEGKRMEKPDERSSSAFHKLCEKLLTSIIKKERNMKDWNVNMVNVLDKLASNAPINFINKIVSLLIEQKDLVTLLKSKKIMDITTCVLHKCNNDTLGMRLVSELFASDDLLNTYQSEPKASKLKIFAAIASNSSYLDCVREKKGEVAARKIEGLYTRYLCATKSKDEVTHEKINAKLSLLQASQHVIANKSHKRQRIEREEEKPDAKKNYFKIVKKVSKCLS